MIACVHSSGDHALDELAWQVTLKEVNAGYAEIHELHEYGLNALCFTPRWPKWELKEDGSWSCRNISDWKKSGGNAATELREKYTPEDLSQAYAIVRIWKEAMGALCPLKGYRVDYAMAFRQNPRHPIEALLTLELAWNPHTQKVVVIKTLGQAFGGKGAQMNYVRDPAAMVAIGRNYLALAISHFSDDTWSIEPSFSAGSSYTCWLELNDLIGWRYDLDKSPPPTCTFWLLGAELFLGTSSPFGKVRAARRELLIKRCQFHLQSNKLSSSDAASLRGSLAQAQTHEHGKFGVAALRPLCVRQYANFTVLNPAIRASLEFWIKLLRTERGRPIPFDIQNMPLHITFSDGEGTGSVAVGYWQPKTRMQPKVIRTDVPEYIYVKGGKLMTNPSTLTRSRQLHHRLLCTSSQSLHLGCGYIG